MRVLLEENEFRVLDQADGMPVNFSFRAQGKDKDNEIRIMIEAVVRVYDMPKYVKRVTDKIWELGQKP